MENNDTSVKSGMTSFQRQRRSIFGTDKPKPDSEEPKILLNGDTFSDWKENKQVTESTFYQPTNNATSNVTFTKTQSTMQEPRRNTGLFYLQPENPINKVVITNPMQKSSCVRPSSLGKRSSIVFQNKVFERPVSNLMSQSKIITVPPPASTQILTSSKLIPSQTNNMLSSIMVSKSPSQLQRKNIIFQGKPHQNIIFKHSPVKTQVIQTMSEIPVPRVVIQEDPKTLSEINRLASLNQYLSQQFTIVNNELHSIRTKTYQKEVVNDFEFLQKSQNRIDDIFIRETNHALMKLDEISRCASSKGFSRSSNSRVKRNPSPVFTRTNQTSQQYYMTNPGQSFTPVKIVEQMQNSSYIPCNHIDPMAIYDEQV